MLNKLAFIGLLGAIVAPARYADTIIAGARQAQGLLYGPENFRSLILEPVMEAPDLTQILTITDGIKAK